MSELVYWPLEVLAQSSATDALGQLQEIDESK